MKNVVYKFECIGGFRLVREKQAEIIAEFESCVHALTNTCERVEVQMDFRPACLSGFIIARLKGVKKFYILYTDIKEKQR